MISAINSGKINSLCEIDSFVDRINGFDQTIKQVMSSGKNSEGMTNGETTSYRALV